jgi:hypothetical protein
MAKKAIILRGPPAIGKSTIKDCLLKKLALGEEAFLNLDKGQASQIPDRESQEILILELAYGEDTPPSTRYGLTRNPKQWVESIRSQGRDIQSFLVYAEWAKAQQRVRSKWREDGQAQACWKEDEYVQNQRPYHEFYTTEECGAFAANAGLSEQRLDFDKSAEELAEYVLLQCGITP